MSDQIKGMFTSITASMVDLIVIVILDIIFLFLAKETSEMNHNYESWIITHRCWLMSHTIDCQNVKSGSQILKCLERSKNTMIPTLSRFFHCLAHRLWRHDDVIIA